MSKKSEDDSKKARNTIKDYLASRKRKYQYNKCRRKYTKKERNLSDKCTDPVIPSRYGFRDSVDAHILEWNSLSEAEDALNTDDFPLPEGSADEVIRSCNQKDTVRDKVECVGNWADKNIRYDGNHASLSVKSADVIKHNSDISEGKRSGDNKGYPMHRYMNSLETWEAKAGICGENSSVMVAILRRMGIPSMLYRPSTSHFATISEDVDKHEFYVYDSTLPSSSCIYHGSPENPAKVLTKRWSPDSAYTYGVTPFNDFYEWTLGRRRKLGTAKACLFIAGRHKPEEMDGEKIGVRRGYFIDEKGNLIDEKIDVDGIDEEDKEKVKTFFDKCVDYIDRVYDSSSYYNISYDTENILNNPPSEELIEMLNGKEIIDLEHAYECVILKHNTPLGMLVEKTMESRCAKKRSVRNYVRRGGRYNRQPYSSRQAYFNKWDAWNRAEAEKDDEEELVRGSASSTDDCAFEHGDITDEEFNEGITQPNEEDLWGDERDDEDMTEEELLFQRLGYIPEDEDDYPYFIKGKNEEKTKEEIMPFKDWVFAREKEHKDRDV